MIALLFIVLAAWIASSIGQVVLRRLSALRDYALERWVYASALGLGIAAYGVLCLGLCGLLTRGPIALWWAFLALCGIPGMRVQAHDLAHWLQRARQSESVSEDERHERGTWKIVKRLCVIGLVVMAGVGVIGCFQPPGAMEWDALAYHLADPKIYILTHRISVLPTQHQSNFPFTVEMLFTVGLLFQGPALANLFHFLYAVLTVVALIAFSTRRLNGPTGLFAALIYATTPLVIWEASVAYIDLAGALYATLALFAALSACDSWSKQAVPMEMATGVDARRRTSEWTMLAGISMGLALGVKYLALVPLALAAGLLSVHRLPIRSVVLFVCAAVVIGSPWYIKNLMWMRNPVYPFYYRAFPQTRYWSTDRERTYNHEQNGFGYPHSLTQPREALLNLLQSPWRIAVNAERYSNAGELSFCVWIGGLYGGLILSLTLLRKLPWLIRDVVYLTTLQLIVWFFLAQIGRYVLQFLPLAALLAGYAGWRLVAAPSKHSTMPLSVWRGLVAALIGGQFLYVVWSLFTLPTGGAEAVDLRARTGLLPTAIAVPEALADAADPTRADALLHKGLDIYDAEQWVNRNAGRNAGVVLYDATLGYYLDRPYLWGNGEHSSYIPYASLRDGNGLTEWLRQRGFQFAIIDLNWSPRNTDHARIPEEQAVSLLEEWYESDSYPAGSWRSIVADALRKGIWQVADVEHGNVVLQIGQNTPISDAQIDLRRRN